MGRITWRGWRDERAWRYRKVALDHNAARTSRLWVNPGCRATGATSAGDNGHGGVDLISPIRRSGRSRLVHPRLLQGSGDAQDLDALLERRRTRAKRERRELARDPGFSRAPRAREHADLDVRLEGRPDPSPMERQHRHPLAERGDYLKTKRSHRTKLGLCHRDSAAFGAFDFPIV